MPLLTKMLPAFVPLLRKNLCMRLKQKNVEQLVDGAVLVAPQLATQPPQAVSFGSGSCFGLGPLSSREAASELLTTLSEVAAAPPLDRAKVTGSAPVNTQIDGGIKLGPRPKRPLYYIRFVNPRRPKTRTEFGRRLQACTEEEASHPGPRI